MSEVLLLAFVKTGPCCLTGEGEEKRLFQWKSRALEIVKWRTKLLHLA